jgi:hypothetical protein
MVIFYYDGRERVNEYLLWNKIIKHIFIHIHYESKIK